MRQERLEWMVCLGNLASTAEKGKNIQPEDSDKVMWYRESKDGVMLEEGINEAGAFSAWIALQLHMQTIIYQ